MSALRSNLEILLGLLVRLAQEKQLLFSCSVTFMNLIGTRYSLTEMTFATSLSENFANISRLFRRILFYSVRALSKICLLDLKRRRSWKLLSVSLRSPSWMKKSNLFRTDTTLF